MVSMDLRSPTDEVVYTQGDDSSNLTYWVEELPKVGGIIHRLILAGAIEQPLFVVGHFFQVGLQERK